MQTLELDGTEWECWSCCKIMPTAAIYVRGYDDFVPTGGVVVAERMNHEGQNWYEGRRKCGAKTENPVDIQGV